MHRFMESLTPRLTRLASEPRQYDVPTVACSLSYEPFLAIE